MTLSIILCVAVCSCVVCVSLDDVCQLGICLWLLNVENNICVQHLEAYREEAVSSGSGEKASPVMGRKTHSCD